MTIFADLEASSLHRGSFPVEIAWCSGDLTRGWSALIRPCPRWTEWSKLSEATHGLSLAVLTAEGLAASDVMRRLNADLTETRCVSDNPNHDVKWLYVLARGCEVDPTFVMDTMSLDALLATARWKVSLTAENADTDTAAGMAEEVGLIAHRALDDAVMHALRLGAIAIVGAKVAGNADMAAGLRRTLIDRARTLIAGSGRRSPSGGEVKYD